jgi:Lrp/AsnC family transcriptional regulator, leucine-responsive regulatory protein
MFKIDVKDRKILYHLDLNSRQSLKTIGSKVRLSKTVVQYRIDRLVKTGIIKNFYTSIDFYKLGYINLGIYINYQYYTPEIEKEIIQYFVNSKHAWFIANIQGKFDVIVLFSVSNMNQFFSFWKKTLTKYRFYFQSVLISFFTKTHYLPISYLLEEQDTTQRLEHELIDGGTKVAIDDTDRAILEHISLNSRKPIIEIAEKLKISSTTIANRIKKLENIKVINGYRINIDYLKLGLQLFNVQFNLRNYDKINHILSYVKRNPYLISASEVIDSCDLSLNYHIKNFNELHFIIKDIYNKFPNDIKNHMTNSFPEIYKQNYNPKFDL